MLFGTESPKLWGKFNQMVKGEEERKMKLIEKGVVIEEEDESREVTSVSFIKGEMHFLINSIRKDSERLIRRNIFGWKGRSENF